MVKQINNMAPTTGRLTVQAASLLLVIVQVIAGAQAQECRYELVESMPDGINLSNPKGSSVRVTHEALLEMIANAKRTLRISSFYLTLTPKGGKLDHPSTEPGQNVLDAILDATRRGVDVEVIVDHSNKVLMSNQHELDSIKEAGGRVKLLNIRRLLGAGVLHSKFMIADNETFYVGSANFDWRAYRHVKEIGISFINCPVLAQDLDRIQQTYALMSDQETVPERMSWDLKALTNLNNTIDIGNVKVALAGAPPAFNVGTGRTEDIDALLHTIETAEKFVDISVMNYSPQQEYGRVKDWWPVIENALRRAATERKIKVRLLFSKWVASKPTELVWYKSLNAFHTPLLEGGIHVKLFEVPSFDEFQKSLPFCRVKHDKFIVTDKGLYIGTSNWSPEYFRRTGGVAVVMEPNSQSGEMPQVIATMQDIFERDFNSEYSHELD